MSTESLSPEEIQNNINNEPPLAKHIKPYEKMGYDWDVDKKTIQRVGVDASDNLLGYCRFCDAYRPIDEMSIDTWKPHGIKPHCKECVNEQQRGRDENKSNNNGDTSLPNITIVDPIAETAEREACRAAVEKIWNEAPPELTFEALKQVGLIGMFKIYIIRWFGISNELMQIIKEEINSNIDLFYIGQTNGNKIEYNGSGTDAEIVKKLTKDDPNVREEIRIIDIVSPDKVNWAELEKIKETGALKYGLNSSRGQSVPKKISSKIEWNFFHKQDLDFYLTMLVYSRECEKTVDELVKSFAFCGLTAYEKSTKSAADSAFSGDIMPALDGFKTTRP